jgi:hypothetical protein
MFWIAPEWVEYQRRRFARPDAHRYVRPDAYRWQRPDQVDENAPSYLRKFRSDETRAAESDREAAARADAELQEQRLALARLRLDWELLKFALGGRKAGFNPDQPRDDRGRWTDAGSSPGAGEGPSSREGHSSRESFAAARRRGRSLAFCTAQYAADGLICRTVAPSQRRACWAQANLRWSNCLVGRRVPDLNF